MKTEIATQTQPKLHGSRHLYFGYPITINESGEFTESDTIALVGSMEPEDIIAIGTKVTQLGEMMLRHKQGKEPE